MIRDGCQVIWRLTREQLSHLALMRGCPEVSEMREVAVKGIGQCWIAVPSSSQRAQGNRYPSAAYLHQLLESVTPQSPSDSLMRHRCASSVGLSTSYLQWLSAYPVSSPP